MVSSTRNARRAGRPCARTYHSKAGPGLDCPVPRLYHTVPAGGVAGLAEAGRGPAGVSTRVANPDGGSSAAAMLAEGGPGRQGAQSVGRQGWTLAHLRGRPTQPWRGHNLARGAESLLTDLLADR